MNPFDDKCPAYSRPAMRNTYFSRADGPWVTALWGMVPRLTGRAVPTDSGRDRAIYPTQLLRLSQSSTQRGLTLWAPVAIFRGSAADGLAGLSASGLSAIGMVCP